MRRAAKAAIILCLLAVVCAASACTGGESYVFTDVTHLGSALKALVYCDADAYKDFSARVAQILEETDSELNSQNPESFVYKFNEMAVGERLEMSELVYGAWQVAYEAYTATYGAYDPTVAGLVDLWGFSSDFYGNPNRSEPYDRIPNSDGALPLPDKGYIEAFMTVTGMDNIAFCEESGKKYLRKLGKEIEIGGKKYSVRLDFGGLAKGLAVEKIVKVCEELGIERGYISYGSSSVYLLKNKDKSDWSLKLTHPRGKKSDDAYYQIETRDVSASTSGDYERFYMLDGKRYSHIIDVKTGRPIDNGVCSVTVIGGRAAVGDCLSTALCAAGKEAIIAFSGSDYALRNGLTVVAAFETEDGIEVFSTADGKILSGRAYER